MERRLEEAIGKWPRTKGKNLQNKTKISENTVTTEIQQVLQVNLKYIFSNG